MENLTTSASSGEISDFVRSFYQAGEEPRQQEYHNDYESTTPDYLPALSPVNPEQYRRDTETRNLRQEQNRAYEDSLKADRKKARARKQREEAKEKEEREAREQEERRALALEAKKSEMIKVLPEEPREGDVVTVAVKMPSGKRIQRRFLKEDPLLFLYYFLFLHEDTSENFEVFQAYPRKQLVFEPNGVSFGQLGAGKSIVVYLNDLEA